MKIRSIKYILKEGFSNAYRNKLMSLASISIITAALILFGIFYLILVNLNHNLDILAKQPQMEAFCLPELTDEQVDAVEYEIKNNPEIETYKKVTKKEAFEKLKKYLNEGNVEDVNGNILEGYDESFMNVSFIVQIKDPVNSHKIAENLENMSGVQNVTYSQQTIDFIESVGNWVKIISTVLIGVLLIVSLFIISNTIRLTVFARRKEINIMKYIGATDWFIRWPFVFEGIIIGCIGALFAFLLVAYIYSLVEPKFASNILELGNEFTMISFENIWGKMLGFYLVISVLIGSAGSIMSIRKHLKV